MNLGSYFKDWLPKNSFLMARKRASAQTQPLPAKTETTPHTDLVFVAEIDPFSRPSGTLFEKMIQAMGTSRKDVTLILLSQVEFSSSTAKVVVALGERVSKALGSSVGPQKIPVIATFEPDYLAQNPSAKKEAWEHLKSAMSILGWKAKI